MFRATYLRSLFATTATPSFDEVCKPHMVVAAAVVCAVLPVDLVQLVFMIIGALCYSLLRMPMFRRKNPAGNKGLKVPVPPARGFSAAAAPPWRVRPRSLPSSGPSAVQPLPHAKTPTAMPIAPVVFMSEGWEGEVSELLGQLAPTPESTELVQRVATTVDASIRHLFPGVEVTGIASTDFRSSTAFGVATPEVEIVIKVKPEILIRRCCLRGGGSTPQAADMNKIQKSTMRSITERLVSDKGFKFRRSAFRGQEPKVTLLAPRWAGVEGTFPIEVSINATTPFRNMALVNECKRLDSRIEDLCNLVRRWSKDRAICHAPKGHLPRFQWNLLVAYFMQVGNVDEQSRLPPMALEDGHSLSASVVEAPIAADQMSVAALFKAFVRFYTTDFEWGREVVSVRSGKRSSRSAGSPASIYIEDPFEASLDLGTGLTMSSYKRLREELSRTKMLCERNASLAELLELWAPADEATPGGTHAESGEE